VPEIYDVLEGGTEIVMQRIEGPIMADAMLKRPNLMPRMCRELADLHDRLHVIPAPDWLPDLGGDRLVHLDLHPLNVMSTPGGLVVIDWANARRGDPATDVANTWSLLACAEPPGGLVDRALVAIARGLLLRTFLASVDRAAAQRAMPALVEWRVQDRNHTDAERRRIRRLAR
jgi:hypothetical protein